MKKLQSNYYLNHGLKHCPLFPFIMDDKITLIMSTFKGQVIARFATSMACRVIVCFFNQSERVRVDVDCVTAP
jgi:hypothetical protein